MRKHDATFADVIKGRASFAEREKEARAAIAQKAAEAANAAYEEESRGEAMIRIREAFQGRAGQKPAEKTELSALEELLFERTRLAVMQHDNGGRSAVQYGRFSGLYDLIRDAGLEARYYAWKKEHGYEKT